MIGVSQKTAWLMIYRIRLAMRAPSFRAVERMPRLIPAPAHSELASHSRQNHDTRVPVASVQRSLPEERSRHLAYAQLKHHAQAGHQHGHRSATKDS
jgi:hypothetical protein